MTWKRSAGPRKPRPASTYRAARRNQVKEIRGVWRPGEPPNYRPAGPKQTLGLRFGRKEIRPLTYRPNGEREVARRKRQFTEWLYRELTA